ncbi:MAG: Gfo/Idh/MocA family oxidoreductase [Planctomycetes bacterium]|nr:Gfo/Idh/MocA family oxidoreductase [Planctomycetota bacterium]
MGISLGIVGLGSFGTPFAELFNAHPLVDRIALCDHSPERVRNLAERPAFQKKFKSRDAYDSLESICRSDLDALAIITQHWLHAPQALQALEAGKHVYSAVPVVTLPDSQEILDWCDRLVRGVRRSGLRYMLGETTFYRPETMFCRRKALEGAFGNFVYAEGEYFHDVDLPACNLRDVIRHRMATRAGEEWKEKEKQYLARGIRSGPMHYPTHSTAGPISVMRAHAVKVCAWGTPPPAGDAFFEKDAFSNETALFWMSNGSTMRIAEHRQIGHVGEETFRIFGTQATFKDFHWVTKTGSTALDPPGMRDPLPAEVEEAFRRRAGGEGVYGGHGGSHAYLVHEFVDAVARDRHPAVNVWEAARYMAPGAIAHQSALREGEVLAVPDWGDAP